MTTKDLKSQLQHLEIEVNRMRQSVEDSSIVAQPKSNSKLSYEVVAEEDWDFPHDYTNRTRSAMSEMLSTLSKAGDKIKIGPFGSDKEARQAQTRVGYIVYTQLKWPKLEDEASYESHTKGAYLFVKRLV